jgi:hypothetical protein
VPDVFRENVYGYKAQTEFWRTGSKQSFADAYLFEGIDHSLQVLEYQDPAQFANDTSAWPECWKHAP